MNLKRLLKPRKIAIVGASDKETLGGFSVKLFLENCPDRIDDLFLVSQNRNNLFGKKCYPSLTAIQRNIDLVIVCTPKSTVEQIILEAADIGAKGAIVFASGYSETGKKPDIDREHRLKMICEERDLALMGPNCAGFLNFVDQIFAFGFHVKINFEPGKIALLSQSGQVCTSLLDSPKASFSYLISSGNSKIVTIEDYMEFLIDDEKTNVISIYLEGVNKPDKFIENLKKAAIKKKPIVVLKAGKSEKGKRAAASHTGSLTGSDQCFDAIFTKFGVIRVDDMEDLISTSAALEIIPALPKRNAFVAVNASGGETAICADICSMFGLEFPELEEQTITKLNEFLPDYSTAQNPLDTTANVCYDSDIYATVLETALNDPNVEAMIIGLTITENAEYASTYHMTIGIVKFMKKGNKKPIFIIPVIESGRNKDLIDKMKAVGVPVLPPHSYAFKIIKHILEYSQYDISEKILEVAIPDRKVNGGVALSEHQSKNIIKELGIPVPEETIAENEEDALRIADQIGFPVVMKIDSNEILHKSDAGGVILNIMNAKKVKESYRSILSNVRKYNYSASINGILVQKMLPKGLETIIGVKSDPLFGPMVMFGLGGVFVEVFEDVSLYPAPFGKAEALEMINSLRSSNLFHGYRNHSELDVNALASTLVAVSDFAVKNKNRLLEMDINPLVVYEKGEGVAALDGLIITAEESLYR